jgi:hypothetical protein
LATKSILPRDRSRSLSPAVPVDVSSASPPAFAAFPACVVDAAFVVYDERCQEHRGGQFDEEDPARIVGIFDTLKTEA